ncbi:MAG: hypothetical protein KTR20_12235 [Cellvibrionaceae bacterium]|nr:hypothetical protein [Cellvibrionaceae bacterium]
MALPLVPIVLGAGLLGTGSFLSGSATGAAASDKLGVGISITGFVVGLFLIFMLIQRFGLLKGG